MVLNLYINLSNETEDLVAPTTYPAGNRVSAKEFELPEILPTSAVWSIVRDSLRLSERELKIAQGVFAKQEQDAIAAANGFTREFVYRSLQRIYIKLRIGSRIELNSKVTEILAAELKYPRD